MVARIAAFERKVYAQSWREIREQIARIEVSSGHRCFVVNRMGSTGSAWLAKLLNSHPDVWCSHEGILARVFPSQSFDSGDIVELIRQMASDGMHGAYLAAGDVGSVWSFHAVALRGKFSTALLVRHPARVLHTRLQVYPGDQSFTEIPSSSGQALRELWDIDVKPQSPQDQVFLHDLLTFARQGVLVGSVDQVLRIEDLRDPGYCIEALLGLTGVRYDADLIARAVDRRVNVRTRAGVTIPEILAGFSASQRRWYGTILGDVAPLLGYDLDGGD